MIEILYTIAGTVAVVASSPQVIQLVKAGRSDELSVTTWGMWCGTQTISLAYAIALQVPLLILFNSLWVIFYLIMTNLILYYRKYPRPLQPEMVEVEAHSET